MRQKTLRPIHAPCPRCAGEGKIPVYLGDDLRRLRESLEPPVSIRQLAERLRLSPAYLSDVELGRRRATDRIVNAYNDLR